ncbi:NDP-sugar pyrophosphorylase family protein [Bradyrhizobium sp. i1.7.7]
MLNGTRAVILAAGMGSRLRPYTEFVPKPLVEVNGTPMLHNALHQLSELGAREATIVVGYREEAIEQSCGHRFEEVDIEYVHNPIFDRTGSAYSLWLARNTMLAGDTVFLEGDVFFEREVLERTLRTVSSTKQSVAAVAAFNAAMSGSAVELADDGFCCHFRHEPDARRGPGQGSLQDHQPDALFRRSLARTAGASIAPGCGKQASYGLC